MQPPTERLEASGDSSILALRTWKKMPKVEDMPSIAIHSAAASPNAEYTRWKVHGDCVTQVKTEETNWSLQATLSVLR